MSPASVAQLAFATEFALFLVAVAGLTCAVRPGLLSSRAWARSALAVGFLGLATASFLRGSLIVDASDEAFLVALRMVSAALIGVGLLRWRGRRSATAVGIGLVLLVVAAVSSGSARAGVPDGLRLAASLALALGLVSAARRSISVRIAVDAAALVLGVVLVVAIAVSVTVADNVDGEAERRYAARAGAESDAVSERARSGLGPARLVAGVLAGERSQSLTAARPLSAADRTVLADALARLTAPGLLDVTDPVVLVGFEGAALAATPAGLASSTRLALAGDAVVAEALRARAERQGVTVVGDAAYALAAAPVVVRSPDAPQRFAGVVVVARPLDRTYLQVRGTGGERLSLVLATSRRVIARTGEPGTAVDLQGVAADVVATGERPRRRSGERFVAAAPVAGGDGRTVLAFVVSAPADAAEATREALFRTLFLVALGAALVAVVLAVVVGERIGRGLRQLTVAARRLQAGALDTRVQVGRRDDELGILGDAFTSMSRSIKVKDRELRAAAAEEAKIRARLEAVVSGMGEALVAVDRAGSVIELNRSAEELLHCSRDEAIGRPVEDLVAWRREDGRAVAVSRKDLVDGVSRAADLAVGDRTIPVLVTTGLLPGAQGTEADEGAVMVLRDVRREREVDDLKSSILANIGHELLTPLTPIKGYAAMLRDRTVDHDQARTFAGEIIGAVDQLERVVHQLTTFATIAAGRLVVEPEPVTVGVLAEAIRRRWSGSLDGSHHLVLHALDPSRTIDVDAPLLHQAVDELVGNAVKYSPDGGAVTVTFEVEGSELAIAVTDEGIGIDADRLEALAALADPFRQGDASETRRFGGLGLGLACAERIVRAHGGRLDYHSAMQSGSRVTIVLPMDQGLSARSR